VMSDALASLDTEPGIEPEIEPPHRATFHVRRKNSLRASSEFRVRLDALDEVCSRLLAADDADEPVALAAELTSAVERVRACREFRDAVLTPAPRHG